MRTTAFRNLADAVVDLSAKTVFLVGENGQGKTNFLEAVYFCSYASSFRAAKDGDLGRNGLKDFSVAGTVCRNPADSAFSNEILVKREGEKKTVLIDDKKAEDRKELLSVIPCIVFCHDDMNFVKGSPEQCRWFFDQVLSLYDPAYLEDLRSYRKSLRSRNAVLRDALKNRLDGEADSLLDALDAQCAFYGTALMEKRRTAAVLFSEVFSPLYGEVSGIEGMEVRYVPSWKGSEEDVLREGLRRRRQQDLAAGLSMTGPHRDRYLFVLEGADFVATASTGQRRLLALLLRVAQARRFSQMTGRNPVLLLDDVLLEMDGGKRRRFLSVLPGYDQAFFTFLPDEPFDRYQNGETLVYNVAGGKVEK
ncbi:MAG: DNA replication and repair protein RecF [Treponema sp.]|nr:DNA replication and repair protein RecF [Treponema sp.]